MSATDQRNSVSEGIAFGLCIIERYELPFPKLSIDFAFEHAWRNWPDQYRDQFPQVSTDLRNGLGGSLVMTRATEKKRTFAFFWDRNQPPTIYARQNDWDSGNSNDLDFALKVIGGDVPHAGWLSLAHDFVGDLDGR